MDRNALTYLRNNIEDNSILQKEDVVMTLLPWITGMAFVKEFTTKNKAWNHVKEMERYNVMDTGGGGNKEEEKKS